MTECPLNARLETGVGLSFFLSFLSMPGAGRGASTCTAQPGRGEVCALGGWRSAEPFRTGKGTCRARTLRGRRCELRQRCAKGAPAALRDCGSPARAVPASGVRCAEGRVKPSFVRRERVLAGKSASKAKPDDTFTLPTKTGLAAQAAKRLAAL